MSRGRRSGLAEALRAHGAVGLEDDLETLLQPAFYAQQAGEAFVDAGDALVHYLETGAAEGLDPHPLFDTAFYLAHVPEARSPGVVPLVHFLVTSREEVRDPNPYFDTEYYYSQVSGFTRRGVNALVHYVKHAAAAKACNPNQLFGIGYYLAINDEARAPGDSPLEHYLRVGWRTRRPASQVHQRILATLRGFGRQPLLRGSSGQRTMLLFASGESAELALAAQDVLADDYGIDALAVLPTRPVGGQERANVLALDEYVSEPDALRPSALRFLARSLAAWRPLGALTDVSGLAWVLRSSGTPVTLLVRGHPGSALLAAPDASAADRIVFTERRPVSDDRSVPVLPPKAAVRVFAGDARPYAATLLELADRDLGLRATGAPKPNGLGETRRILIPCADWGVSGVNAALEALAARLLELGWDVELLFTRDRAAVEESAGGASQLPQLPHRFLRREAPGVEAMWEALIETVEQEAPCIVFTTYDFVANSVVPAFSNDVGVVMWAQADDGDYYEQVYRLGRYCNAVVCVSEHIRAGVESLHPGIAGRAHVIHNSSMPEAEIVADRTFSEDRVAIVYTGRLVQYQKRILDFVPLADALEAAGLPFTISLIGTFPVHDAAAKAFPERAASHLESGQIRLLGRLSRAEILAQLDAHDFFVLLSDFEGLPLALVEAMARGCVPVVAEMESGIPEIVTSGTNGVILAGRDYGRWAEEIGALWRNRPLLAEVSREARATVRAEFAIEGVAAAFDGLFAGVANEIATGAFARPPALHWGVERSLSGDVLPPPSMFRPVKIANLG